MAILIGIVNVSSSDVASIVSRLTDTWLPIGAVAPELRENNSPFISSFGIPAPFTVKETDRARKISLRPLKRRELPRVLIQ